MFHAFGCLIFLIFGFVFLFAAFFNRLITFILALFGIKFPNDQTQNNTYRFYSGRTARTPEAQAKYEKQSTQSTSDARTNRQNEKIFRKDDNEYVDFEDVPEK